MMKGTISRRLCGRYPGGSVECQGHLDRKGNLGGTCLAPRQVLFHSAGLVENIKNQGKAIGCECIPGEIIRVIHSHPAAAAAVREPPHAEKHAIHTKNEPLAFCCPLSHVGNFYAGIPRSGVLFPYERRRTGTHVWEPVFYFLFIAGRGASYILPSSKTC